MYQTVMKDLLQMDSVYSPDGPLFVVAECCGGKVVGFVGVIREDESTAELVNLYVHPSHRRRGLGVRLLKEVEDFCASKSVKDIWLHTCQRNDAARRLYEKVGFEPQDLVTFPPPGSPFCSSVWVPYVKTVQKQD